MPSARYKINDPLRRIIINFIDVKAMDMPIFPFKNKYIEQFLIGAKIVK